jgi:phosphoglycerol transferase MdoB-like AlkP superfamily enzyme
MTQQSEEVADNIIDNMRLQWAQHWDALSFLIIVAAKVLYSGKQISQKLFDIKVLQPPVIASILPIIALAYFFKEKQRIKYFYIVNVIISLILLADTMYYRAFKDVVSLGTLESVFFLGDISLNPLFLLRARDFIYIIDLILFIPLMKLMKNVKRRQYSRKLRIFMVIAIFSFGAAIDGNFIYKTYKNQTVISSAANRKIYLSRNLGGLNFHALDLYNFVSEKLK